MEEVKSFEVQTYYGSVTYYATPVTQYFVRIGRGLMPFTSAHDALNFVRHGGGSMVLFEKKGKLVPFKQQGAPHGERAAVRSRGYRSPRHLPKYLGSKELVVLGLRREHPEREDLFNAEPFAPSFMGAASVPAAREVEKVARPQGPTFFEMYLIDKKRRQRNS